MNYTTKIKLMEEFELPTKIEYFDMSSSQREYFYNNLMIEQLNKLSNNLENTDYLKDLIPIKSTSKQDTFELTFVLPFPVDFGSVEFTLKGNLSQLDTKPKFKFDIYKIFNDDKACFIQNCDCQKMEIELQEWFKTLALNDCFKWGMGILSQHSPSRELKIDWEISKKYQEIVEANLKNLFKNKEEINLSKLYDGIDDLKYSDYGFTPPEPISPPKVKPSKIKF